MSGILHDVAAISIGKTGGPKLLELTRVSVAAPVPGEVRVRNRAVGLNLLDIYYRTGRYPPPLPFIPGHEGAGIVEAVGAGFADLTAADSVRSVLMPRRCSGPPTGWSDCRNDAEGAAHIDARVIGTVGSEAKRAIARVLGIQEPLKLLFGQAIGYVDEDHAAARLVQNRCPVGEFVERHD